MSIINEPIGSNDILIRDLVDADGTTVVPAAVYKVATRYQLIGIAGEIPTKAAPQAKLPNMAAPECLQYPYDLPRWLVGTQNGTAILVRLPHLWLNIKVSVQTTEDRVEIVPFVSRAEGGLRKVLKWTPHGQLYMLAEPSETKLFLTRTEGDGAIYMLPLPNIHDNGKMCMGDAFLHDDPLSNGVEVSRRIEHITRSEWNADLMPPAAMIQTLLKWEADEPHEQVRPHVNTFWSHARVIHDSNLSQIMLSIRTQS